MISDWRIIDQVHSFRRTITVSSTERVITKQLFVYRKRRVFLVLDHILYLTPEIAMSMQTHSPLLLVHIFHTTFM